MAKNRKNTPRLDYQGKEEYIREHLHYELRWLLAAATEWHIQRELQLEKDGYEVQVFAMDSAFVHARTLFEFFLKASGKNYYGADEFLGPGFDLQSAYYNSNGAENPPAGTWVGPLHGFVMHAQNRSHPIPLDSLSSGKQDLNRMPVDFAHEVLRLWEDFETKLSQSNDPGGKQLSALAQDRRKDAIKCAANVVISCVATTHAKDKGIKLTPIF
jgi:hypothetical protein